MIQSQTTRQREPWIDALRGFGAVLVVIGHSLTKGSHTFHMIYGFHMPLFFIISGYLMTPEKYESVYELARNKFKRCIMPFFCMGLVNLLIEAAYNLGAMPWREVLRTAGGHLFWLIYSYGSTKKMPNCSPLWFLPCLYLSMIFAWLFLSAVLRAKQTHRASADGHTAPNIPIYYYGLAAIAAVLYVNAKGVKHLPWNVDMAVIGAAFTVFGYYLRRGAAIEKLSFPLWPMLLILGLGIIYNNSDGFSMNSSNLGNPVLSFAGALAVNTALFALFYACGHCRLKLPLLTYIGQNTMLVMGYNYAVNKFLKLQFNQHLRGVVGLTWAKLHWGVRSALALAALLALMVLWNGIKRLAGRIARGAIGKRA